MTESGKEFEEWLVDFMAFQKECHGPLSKSIPDEIQMLKYEAQELEPLLFKAQCYAADAISCYYEAKAVAMKKLNFKEWVQSSIEGMAKSESHKQLWAKEAAERLVQVIISRGFKVAQALKFLEVK
jgi:hypothetical protein